MAKKRTDKQITDDLLPGTGEGREEMKKLYTLSFDEAVKAQNKSKCPFNSRGILYRWFGAQELMGIYEEYKKGNNKVIVEALFTCAINSLPLPSWLEKAYLTAYRKVRLYDVKSWDDVFGKPHPKGTHLGTKKQERDKSLLVYLTIHRRKQEEPSLAIDERLFEDVGREYAIGGKTLTAEYYYKWKKQLEGK